MYDGKSFKEIWNDMQSRHSVMHQIEEQECFANCTKLCKPHESNKAVWEIHQDLQALGVVERVSRVQSLLEEQDEVRKTLTHPEFI